MQSCKTCKWAEWQKTKNGRNMYRQYGKCKYPRIQLPVIPDCTIDVIGINTRVAIWADSGNSCPCYQEKEK